MGSSQGSTDRVVLQTYCCDVLTRLITCIQKRVDDHETNSSWFWGTWRSVVWLIGWIQSLSAPFAFWWAKFLHKNRNTAQLLRWLGVNDAGQPIHSILARLFGWRFIFSHFGSKAGGQTCDHANARERCWRRESIRLLTIILRTFQIGQEAIQNGFGLQKATICCWHEWLVAHVYPEALLSFHIWEWLEWHSPIPKIGAFGYLPIQKTWLHYINMYWAILGQKWLQRPRCMWFGGLGGLVVVHVGSGWDQTVWPGSRRSPTHTVEGNDRDCNGITNSSNNDYRNHNHSSAACT